VTRIDRLFVGFDLVAFSPEGERAALALLGRHPLRSLDALQLACALTLGPGGSGEASVRATIAGGDCYCVRFGGPAGGRVTSAPGVLQIVGPRVEAGCL
jgi:hypothetical protein